MHYNYVDNVFRIEMKVWWGWPTKIDSSQEKMSRDLGLGITKPSLLDSCVFYFNHFTLQNISGPGKSLTTDNNQSKKHETGNTGVSLRF